MFGFFKRSSKPEALQAIAMDAPAHEQRGLGSPDSFLFELLGASPVSSGATVSPASAMRVPAVRSAVQAISEAVGCLPCFVYEKAASGARNRFESHPAYPLVHDQANGWTTSQQLREQITRDALLHGNGYAFIVRDRDGNPLELIRLPPTTIRVELDTRTAEPIYHRSDATSQEIIDRQNVLHIAAPSIDGVSGASPVQQCREAIGICITMEAHAARLFGAGARPGGLVSFPRPLGDTARAKAHAVWMAAHGGGKSGGTAVLDDGASFQQLTLSSVDAQFLELWQHSILEICRVFRVPPHLIFELGRATWSNSAEMGATFLKFSLDRWLKCWTGEIRLKLIRPEERGRAYAEFLTDDLLRSDIQARADAYGKLIAARVLNPNEVRAMENRSPYKGGDEFANPHTTTTTTTSGPATQKDQPNG